MSQHLVTGVPNCDDDCDDDDYKDDDDENK